LTPCAQALSPRRGAECQLVAASLVNVTAEARRSVALRWANRVAALAKVQLDWWLEHSPMLCSRCRVCATTRSGGAPRPRREPQKRFGRRLAWHRTRQKVLHALHDFVRPANGLPLCVPPCTPPASYHAPGRPRPLHAVQTLQENHHGREELLLMEHCQMPDGRRSGVGPRC